MLSNGAGSGEFLLQTDAVGTSRVRFELDSVRATLNFQATVERSLPDGNTVERCERAELTLEQIVE